MKVLVTGGNGFVGRALVRRLLDRHELCVLDNVRFGEVRLRPDELARLRLEVADLTDGARVEEIVSSFAPDVIVHLAAIHYIPECERFPVLTAATNVTGTVALLSAAPAGCRVVFASSGAVYGPAEEAHDEVTSVVAPTDVYGWTKAQGETWMHHLAVDRGFAGVIVRLFNAVGPGETNPHLFPEVVAQLKAGRTTLSLGNLTSRRDYVHVDDIAEGLEACATADEVSPGEVVTVNLGTGDHHSAAEILEMIRAASGIDFVVEQDPERLRPVDRPLLVAQVDRIRERFGWKPARDVKQAIADLWATPDLPAAMIDRYRD